MLCHGDPNRPQQPTDQPAGLNASLPQAGADSETLSISSPSRSRLWGWGMGGVIAAVTLPHAACALGLLGGSAALAGGGVALFNWCWHSEVTTSIPVPLAKLPNLPENYEEFSPAVQAQASEALLAWQPVFYEILEKKGLESPGEPIKTAFLLDKDTQDILVVCCKNGALCPCSKPEAYRVGKMADLEADEAWRGQTEVLKRIAEQQ